jgi:hypothetical protein
MGERDHDPDRPRRLDNPKPSNHQQAIEIQGVKFPLNPSFIQEYGTP